MCFFATLLAIFKRRHAQFCFGCIQAKLTIPMNGPPWACMFHVCDRIINAEQLLTSAVLTIVDTDNDGTRGVTGWTDSTPEDTGVCCVAIQNTCSSGVCPAPVDQVITDVPLGGVKQVSGVVCSCWGEGCAADGVSLTSSADVVQS